MKRFFINPNQQAVSFDDNIGALFQADNCQPFRQPVAHQRCWWVPSAALQRRLLFTLGATVQRLAALLLIASPLFVAANALAHTNAHDLERILALYEPGFSSPVLAKRIPESNGRLRGKAAARAYWSAAFAPGVNLRFEHVAALIGR